MSEKVKEMKDEKRSEMNIVRNDVYVMCNEAQVEKVEEMLKSGRRYFGSSGASLTHQISNPIYTEKHKTEDNPVGIDSSLARVGLDGEHKTSRILLDWIEDKPNAVLVDSVHLKGHGEETLNEETGTLDGGDTDHVLILGNFVIIIDSKNWKGRRKYSISDNGEVIRGRSTFPGGKITTRQAGRLWSNALKKHNVVISSIVNITAEKVYVVRDRNWWKQPYRLVAVEDLKSFLDDVWNQLPATAKGNINANLVTSVAANAIEPYNVFKEELGEVAELLEV